MIAVTYKMPNKDGVVYIPCQSPNTAIYKARTLYKKGMLNVKVVRVKEEVLFSPSLEGIGRRNECRKY